MKNKIIIIVKSQDHAKKNIGLKTLPYGTPHMTFELS